MFIKCHVTYYKYFSTSKTNACNSAVTRLASNGMMKPATQTSVLY